MSGEILGSAAEAEDIRTAIAGLTVPALLARQVRERPGDVSIQWRRGGSWQAWTWQQYGDEVARIAGALERAGVRRGDRAVLLARPGPESHAADSAVLLLGGCPISLYTSSPPARLRALIGHSDAVLAVVEDREMLDRLLAVRAELPRLRLVVVLDPGAADLPDGVLRWADLARDRPVDLDARAATATPGDLCTVIYTSGNTGAPKGVLLDHAAVLWQCESYRRRLGRDLTGARWVSYLPMAHIATRFYARYLHVYAGLEDISCANPADVEGVLVERPPQLFFAPPRLWEKFLDSVRAWIDGMADGERAHRLARALRVGADAALPGLLGEPVPAALAAEREELRPACAEIRRRLGLEHLLTGATGAAPTSPQLLAAWIGLGVPMFEGYGLSESTGMLTVDPFAYRFGSVGRPMPGVQLQLAPDGELLFRAGSAFRGYLGDPELTAATVSDDGWISTGDLARFDDGYVVLQGRKKELLITAGGENVSPVGVEFALTAQPLVAQACVVGDGQPSLGALVVLDAAAARDWARRRGLEDEAAAEPTGHPELLAEVGRQIAAANLQLTRQERVWRFRVLPGEWLPDSDELTATAKLRRGQVAAKYAEHITGMFAAPENVPRPAPRGRAPSGRTASRADGGAAAC